MQQEDSKSLFGLSIETQSKSFLTETAKWAKFLAIIGFIACVFIVLAGIVVATQTDEINRSFRKYGESNPMFELGPATIIIYIAIAVLYFFPCLYLLRFSNEMKSALAADDQNKLTTAFQNLKSVFKFFGITTIILISLYLLSAVVLAGSM